MKTAGIELASGTLRVVVLEGTAASHRVALAEEVPLGESPEAVTARRRVLTSVPSQALTVWLSVPDQFLREIRLPFASVAQVPEVLPFEAEAPLPRPVEEMVLSWLPIRLQRQVRAYLAAAAHEVVRQARPAEADGVELDSVTADWCALEETWRPAQGRRTGRDRGGRTRIAGWTKAQAFSIFPIGVR